MIAQRADEDVDRVYAMGCVTYGECIICGFKGNAYEMLEHFHADAARIRAAWPLDNPSTTGVDS
jgi:hypothetical protein